METRNKKNMLVTIGLIGILLANVFLFAPLTTYLGNEEEFLTSLDLILQILSMAVLPIFLLLILIGILLPERLHQRYAVLLAALGLLVWIQGNVLIWDYGLLNGEGIDWSKGSWRGWVDLSIWILTLSAAILYYKKLKNILISGAISVFVLQFLLFSYTAYTNKEKLFKTNLNLNQSAVLADIHRFSADKNVLHLVLDSFQSDIFEYLINHPEYGPNYQESLSGFVFFKETMGIFPYTRFAVPAYLTTKIYKNKGVKDDFVNEALKGKSILNVASDAGFEIDLVSAGYWKNKYAQGQHKNSYAIPDNYHMSGQSFELDNSIKLLDLVLFRLAPHFLKKYIYNDQKWLVYPALIDSAYMQFKFFSHTAFLDDLTENMSLERKAPTYKYLHVQTPHAPLVVREDCSYVGGSLVRNRVSVSIQSKCALDTVIKLFDKMKELGIYDNTLIVIMSDHGGHIRPANFKPQFTINGLAEDPAWMASMVMPVVAIKPPKATGDIQTSSALTSLLDIPDTISSILGLAVEFGRKSMFDIDPDANRERRHYFYSWQRDAWISEHTGPIYEFIVDGSLYDGAWSLGKTYFPPEQNKKIALNKFD